MKKFTDADYDYVLGGLQMRKSEAEKLEASLETNPDDCLKRLRLMQYYMVKPGDKIAKKNNLAHALWLVKNTPDLPPGMGVWQFYNKEEDPAGFRILRQDWMKQLQLHGDDLAVIDNAVIFFQMYDKNIAEQLLLKAKQLDPSNPSWSQKLVHVYSMHSGRASDGDDDDSDDDNDGSDFGTIRELENAIEKSKTRSEKLNNTIALAQFLIGESDVEKRLEVAKRLLDLAQGQESDPNYGPAIYKGNFMYAEAYFEKGDPDKAVEHLLRASETPGSDEVGTFGPDFELARLLWERGEKEAVTTYIRNCQRFWKNDLGACERWLKQIEAGQTPDFNKIELNAKTVWNLAKMAFKHFTRRK